MNNWKFSTHYSSICMVLDEQYLWGQIICRIWLPSQHAIVRVSEADLKPLHSERISKTEEFRISYIATAAKIAELLENTSEDNDSTVLLAPMESNVIPLPHQLHALSRAISGDRVRYLLADEVGLGKTIEAGLIMQELKLRGLVRRTLVVAPKSLAMQWVAEMETHFNENFALINPGDLDALERLECSTSYIDGAESSSDYNPWLKFNHAVVTLDAVKPVRRRKGWSEEKVHQYNKNRYERLLQGQWDLIIVDESHRIGGSTDQVSRYKLGQGLAEAATYLLLLSATPHQGKSDAFHRLISLLDPMSFPDQESVTREKVSEFVIRTEKRKALTAEGEPLFKPRTTQTMGIDLSRNPSQVALYEAVTDYVRLGYNRAIKDKKPHIGFLMVLLQRIVTSSSHAIRTTLERRLNVLENLKSSLHIPTSDELEELVDLDGQMQLDFLIEVDEKGRHNEIEEVSFLLGLAKKAEQTGPDIKTDILMDQIFRLQGEENNDQLKIIIFTEFVATQSMLQTFLEERNFPCSIINGSMSMEERRKAQRDFREKNRILIATDAGGEGLNLQFCHVVINYDLPWNPMRIEQRIGRVDRIGQSKIVRAINFVYEDSVESRVREVLERKLSIIFDEMGIDKSNDILDTSLSGELVEKMMTHIIMEEADPEKEIERTVRTIQFDLAQERNKCAVYKISEDPEPAAAVKVKNHPLPFWVERMVINYVKMNELSVEKDLLGWNFVWPDGEKVSGAIFHSPDSTSDSLRLSLENPKVRGLILNLPQLFSGQPVPLVALEGVPETVNGYWGLFEITLTIHSNETNQIRLPAKRKGYQCVFVSNKGKLFIPTARFIWDQLLTLEPQILRMLSPEESVHCFETLYEAAATAGEELFNQLKNSHEKAIERENQRGMTAFTFRRRSIHKVGLPEVRNYRLHRLEEDKLQWQRELKSAAQVIPDIRPLLIFSIGEVPGDE
ncbi:helicase [Sphaerochaeta halotolerans]|uniref:Helicase n=1 Tax=Sphaerochaeta halotolerans TaxID=2293840 RepID=A0A372ML16_9SPIR|nr:helicase-related protein [Sphaerochaeta halotolerans]RFU95880.1 helicase [Sphaerochaeta halotolerans]